MATVTAHARRLAIVEDHGALRVFLRDVLTRLGWEVAGIAGTCVFTLAGGRRITVEAEGTFDRPYEPFHRGGLNQVRVRADDGRTGTAIYELTGAHHHRYFPDTDVDGELPA